MERRSRRICVLGAGCVGLVSSACLAAWGHRVICVDRESNYVRTLNLMFDGGRPPIFEAGLEPLLRTAREGGRLTFSADASGAVSQSDVVWICVGTPGGEGGEPELSQLWEAVRVVAQSGFAGGEPKTAVLRSTVPPGTTARVQEALPGAEVVFCPEFLRQGSAVADMLNPSRLVIGAANRSSAEKVRSLFPDGMGPVVCCDPVSAELSKLGANAFLAIKVSFANSLANLCEAWGGDVRAVAGVLGLDPRIGPDFLRAGLGFGGSCLPKDTAALSWAAERAGERFLLAEAALAVNRAQPERFAAGILASLTGVPKTAAALGLTFKPGTDDIRESPALAVVRALIRAGVRVRAYDPAGLERAGRAVPELELCSDPFRAAEGAQALLILTDWEEFRSLDLGRIAGLMPGRRIFDGWGLIDPRAAEAAGFVYISVGGGVQNGVRHGGGAAGCGPW